MLKCLLTCILLISHVVFGQDIENILSQPRHYLEKIEFIESDRVTFISSDFAQPQIQTINLRDKISKLEIVKVYYVYTSYRKSESFNQLNLDRQRIKRLISFYPEMFINQNFEWDLIEQTGLDDHLKGETYFHGFILVHRPIVTEKTRRFEKDYVFNFFDHPNIELPIIVNDPIHEIIGKSPKSPLIIAINQKKAKYNGGDQALHDYIQMNFHVPNTVWKNRKDYWANYNIVVDEMGEVTAVNFLGDYSKDVKKAIEKAMKEMPNWSPKMVDGKSINDTVNFELRVSYSPHVKGMYLKDGKAPILSHTNNVAPIDLRETGLGTQQRLKESNVYNSMDSIKGTSQLAMVMDVTGSMHNNIVNATFWLMMNQKTLPFSSFTVFNDGDKTPDHKKEIGSTKGIYFTSFFSEYNETIKTAMSNGTGGDFPENDIEAILYAIRKDNKAQKVLLIADNMSEVKDIELLGDVDLPVSVLVCGVSKRVHQHYIDIVYTTGGTLYFEGNAFNLSTFKKGDSFKIKRLVYTFNGRHFVPA